MKTYVVNLNGGQDPITIAADTFATDGSGTRFYTVDAEGEKTEVAYFYSGQVMSCYEQPAP